MLAEQYIPANRAGYNWFNFVANSRMCNFSATQIAALTTVAGSGTTSLQGLITSLAPVNYVDACRQAGNAMVDLVSIGVLTNTNVGTCAVSADVRNIIAAADPTSSLSGTATTCFAFPI
jgi:hypothetical protein